MRISGNIRDRLLNIYSPVICLWFALSYFIPDYKHVTSHERIYFFAAMLCLMIIVDYTHVLYGKIQSLEIHDDDIFIGGRKILNSDVQFIKYRSFSRSFNIITFDVYQNGIMDEFSVMEKPKLLGIFGPKGSLTLFHLYDYFPELKSKQV